MRVTGRGNTKDSGPTQLAGTVRAKGGLNARFCAVHEVVRPVAVRMLEMYSMICKGGFEMKRTGQNGIAANTNIRSANVHVNELSEQALFACLELLANCV